MKPNFLAPEGLNSDELSGRYYSSPHLLGQLFEAITIPPAPSTSLPAHSRARAPQVKKKRRRNKNKNKTNTTSSNASPLHSALERHLWELHIDIDPSESRPTAERIATQFTSDLQQIASNHSLTLSHRSSDNRLSEAEVFMGTILSTNSQERLRRKAIADLREKTTALVASTLRGIRQQGLVGAVEGEPPQLADLKCWMEVIWACWMESEARRLEGKHLLSSPALRNETVTSSSLLFSSALQESTGPSLSDGSSSESFSTFTRRSRPWRTTRSTSRTRRSGWIRRGELVFVRCSFHLMLTSISFVGKDQSHLSVR